MALTIADGEVITGSARLRAHVKIKYLLHELLVRPTEENDLAMRDWVLKDPTLFIETLPTKNRFCPGGQVFWQPYARDKNWASQLVRSGAVNTFTALFEAGLHPDDPQVFEKGLPTSTHSWITSPTHLDLAFKHGASPDRQCRVPVGKFESAQGALIHLAAAELSYWALKGNSAREKSVLREAMLNRIAACTTILDAGARAVDTDPLAEHPMTAVAQVFEAWQNCSDNLGHEIGEKLEHLCRRLVATGSNVNLPSIRTGAWGSFNKGTPLTAAIRRERLSSLKLSWTSVLTHRSLSRARARELTRSRPPACGGTSSRQRLPNCSCNTASRARPPG
ncbi:hypothetical protein ABIC83_002460 [Roseateles asaccharophilus]|uniref:hypothetical protein n=1 Tax=Roseateles asaccharophilus TaxID=582607 RepID=UPI0038323B44